MRTSGGTYYCSLRGRTARGQFPGHVTILMSVCLPASVGIKCAPTGTFIEASVGSVAEDRFADCCPRRKRAFFCWNSRVSMLQQKVSQRERVLIAALSIFSRLLHLQRY